MFLNVTFLELTFVKCLCIYESCKNLHSHALDVKINKIKQRSWHENEKIAFCDESFQCKDPSIYLCYLYTVFATSLYSKNIEVCEIRCSSSGGAAKTSHIGNTGKTPYNALWQQCNPEIVLYSIYAKSCY